MKKVLLFVGLAGLGYVAYCVARLATAHTSNDPTSPTVGWGAALRSQAGVALVPTAALIAYKVF